MSDRKSAAVRWVILAALVVAGAALRLSIVKAEPLWLDELYSLELSTGHGYRHLTIPFGRILHQAPDVTALGDAAPWWRIWPMQFNDAHPPLYFIGLRFWRNLAGEGDTAARCFSILASTVSIILIYAVAREVFVERPGAALWSAAIMALAPAQIGMGIDTRDYALATMVCLAAALPLLRIDRLGWAWGRAIGLAAGLLAMVLTHYYTAGIALGMAVYVLARFRGSDRWRSLATFVVAAMVFLLAWGPVLVQQLHYTTATMGWYHEPAAGHIAMTLHRLATLPLRLLGEVPSHAGPIVLIAALAYLLPAAVLLSRAARGRNPRLLFPALWLWCGVGLVAAMDLTTTSWYLQVLRYTLASAPGLYMALAGLLPAQSGWVRHLVPAGLLIYCMAALPTLSDKTREDWRSVARFIDHDGAGPGTLIVLAATPPHDWESCAGVLYMGVRHYQVRPGADYLLIDAPANVEMLARLHEYQRVYLVNGWPKLLPRELLPGYDAVDGLRAERIGAVNKMQRLPAAGP